MASLQIPRTTRGTLTRECAALGLGPDDVVMVHASLRAVGPVLGGPTEVVAAVIDAVAPDGTVMAYLGCDSPYDDLGRGLYSADDERFIREHCPAFDRHGSPANREFGAFAEFLRKHPAVRISDHVGARMAAIGGVSRRLTHEHALNFGLGEGSPLARLCDLHGKVLLLGSDLDNVTLLHYAEAVAPIAGKRVARIAVPRLREGARVWQEVEEFDSANGVRDWPDRFFAGIVEAFIAAGHARSGRVGGATSHLFAARALVEFAAPRMVAAAAAIDAASGG